MPQFHVCFTGDATHHRDDMIRIAMGAKGTYYTELDRAMYDARKTNCPVYLVVGRKGSSKKIALAQKAGSLVRIMPHTDFLELEDIKEEVERLFKLQAVNSTPRAPAPAAQAQALCFIRAVPRAPRAAQEIDSPYSDSDSDSDPDLDPDLDPDFDFEMSVPKKKLKVPKKKPKVPKKKPKEARDDLEEADDAEHEAIPAEAVLGIAPVYQLPPDMTPDKYKQIVGPHITSSFVKLSEAPAEVRSSFRSADIPTEKIIDTFVLILTENAELNAAIISTGLQAFVEIAKKLGWNYGYVGGTMRSKLVGSIDLSRSVPTRGTMQRPGSPSPIAHAHPLTT